MVGGVSSSDAISGARDRKRRPSRSAFVINDDVGIYIKYATRPRTRHKEFQFRFDYDHFAELEKLRAKRDRCFVVLVCVKAEEICCMPARTVLRLRKLHLAAGKFDTPEFVLIVTARKRRRFRVYVNKPGARGVYLTEPIIVPRNAFPDHLFEA